MIGLVYRAIAVATLCTLAGSGGDLAAQPATGEIIETTSVRAGQHRDFGRLVFEWHSPVEYVLDQKGRAAEITFDRPARIDLERLRANLPAEIKSATGNIVAGRLVVRLELDAGAKIRHTQDKSRIIVDVYKPDRAATTAVLPRDGAGESPPPRPTTATGATDPPAAEPVALTPKTEPKRAATPPKIDTGGPAALVTVDAVRTGEALVIRFNWRRPVAAVVFRHHGAVWAWFDEAARLDLGALQVSARDVIDGPKQIEVESGSVVRFGASETARLGVWREGNAWVVELRRAGASRPAEPIDVRTQPGGSLLLAAEGGGQPVRIVDRDTGETVAIVPLQRPGRGIAEGRRFVDLELLPSAQGVAVRAYNDKVSVRVQPTSIVIVRDGGLRLSSAPDLAARRSREVAAPAEEGLLALGRWAGQSANVYDIAAELSATVLASPKPQRARRRLMLARFYLAHGLASEALGAIAEILREEPSMQEDLAVHAVRGAANLLMAHFAEAQADLQRPKLKDHPEMAPWIGMLAAAQGDWREAQRRFVGTEKLIGAYPQQLAARFAMIAAEAALAVDDVSAAAKRLDALRSQPLSERQVAYADVLRGHAARKGGNSDAARAIWERIAAHEDRLASSKARFALLGSLIEEQKIAPAEAIERLEALMYAWRGDALEFDIVRQLAELKRQIKDYRGALLLLRDATSNFDGIQGTQEIAQTMSEVFSELFVGDGAEALAPYAALALYEEFRELTPTGDAGDELIRRLTDRLISVDLLAEAARLLEHQIEHRLTGEAKARVGARLAAIRLVDEDAEGALASLSATATRDLPPALARERRMIEARALVNLGRRAEALDLLSADDDPETDTVRLDVHWRDASWQEVSKILSRMLAVADPAKLDDRQARMIVALAVAARLSENRQELDTLRERFGPALAGGPYAAFFGTVTGSASRAVNYRSLAKEAAELKILSAFMANYRDRIKSGSFSALN